MIPTSIYVIMNSSESSQQHVLPNPTTTQPFISKFRKFTIHTFSLLVLFAAIYLGFTRTNYFKVHFLKYSLTSPPPPFHAIGSLFSPPKPVSFPSHCVLWMAPFLSGGGYSSEGWSYVLALHGHRKMQSFRLAIEHRGDL